MPWTPTEPGDRPRATPDPDAVFAALKAAEQSRARWGWRRGEGGGPRSGPPPQGLWGTTIQWVLAAAATVFLAWATYAHGGWVLILSSFDLGVHEFGHMIFFWAPTLWVQFAGSFMQVAAPLALCGYFAWRRDRFAAILMIAWAAESLNNVSVYVGDAQRMALTLFGDDGSGAGHDWHNILVRLGLLGSTDQIAGFVRALSVCLFVAALGLATWGFVHARRNRDTRQEGR